MSSAKSRPFCSGFNMWTTFFSADSTMGRLTGKTSRFIVMVVLTTSFFVVELVTGHITRSLALVSDSYHMLSDVAALIIGLVSLRVRRTFLLALKRILTFSSLAAPEVVKMTTSGEAIDENVIRMTTFMLQGRSTVVIAGTANLIPYL